MTSQRLIQEAKNFLRSGTPIPDEAVRPEILRSWKRCWGSHVPMEHGNKEILPLDAVEERIARRNSLCQVAFPYLDGLYDFIRGSEFLLLFSDEEGYILYARGDEDISRTARENGLVKGACRSESRLGTNGIGTVLVDRIPLQVFGAEHYYEVHANWACSGASVFLPDGDIGGVVCLSGMAEHVNDHTLGMVVAAADAISRQLKLKDAYDQLSKSYRNLSAIIETVPTAMCLLDESLHVVAFNTQATRQLALAPAELSGADFLEVLGCGAVTAEDIKTSLSNRTISFERGEGKHTISLSVESTGHQEYVAQIEQLSSLHKRVNNIMGNEAHFRFQDIIGISPAMGEAVRMAKIAAQNDASVFLSGESGTGKELFAQAIHNASSRRRGPFIAVNCGALPKSLIEAELFGYEGGSFTGARRDGCAASSNWPTAGRSSWTRSGICRWMFRSPCCGCSKTEKSAGSGPPRR